MLFLMMEVGFAVSPDSHVAFLADDLRSFVPARGVFRSRTCAGSSVKSAYVETTTDVSETLQL